MSSNFYNVYVDENCVAENMPLQFALILVKAIYGEFYAEPKLKVSIERVSFDTETAFDTETTTKEKDKNE